MCYIHVIIQFFLYNSVQMNTILSLIFVMHISISMTIHIIFGFRHEHLCTNNYFVTNFVPIRFWKTGIFLCFLAFR